MNRREAIKHVAMVTGSALSPSIVSALLSGCNLNDNGKQWKAKIVTPAQNDKIRAIAELIIPQTDTPGAKAARVNEFIDTILADWFTAAERNHFLQGLAELETQAQENHLKLFVKCSVEEQTALLQQAEKESLEYLEKKTPPDVQQDFLKPFFIQMKELTLTGYYTSEIGATQELKYFSASASYDGCVPYDQIGRSWSD